MSMINMSFDNRVSSKEYYHERQIPNPDLQLIFNHQPEPCICPFCHQSIVTRIKKTSGVVVWLVSGGICLLGCVIGCCLIPFFLDGLKDTTHYCPNCHRIIGRKKRL